MMQDRATLFNVKNENGEQSSNCCRFRFFHFAIIPLEKTWIRLRYGLNSGTNWALFPLGVASSVGEGKMNSKPAWWGMGDVSQAWPRISTYHCCTTSVDSINQMRYGTRDATANQGRCLPPKNILFKFLWSMAFNHSLDSYMHSLVCK